MQDYAYPPHYFPEYYGNPEDKLTAVFSLYRFGAYGFVSSAKDFALAELDCRYNYTRDKTPEITSLYEKIKHDISNWNIADFKKIFTEYSKSNTQQQQTFSPFENAVINLYPKFLGHYNLLIENGYMHKVDGGFLKWDKTKQSLAEYFDYIKQQDKRHSWRDVEQLFKISKLANLLSKNGNAFKKTSKDFENLLKEIKN